MIRLSDNNDLKGIISLWQEAFGDSESDILFFLNSHYNPENTVVYEYNNEIASVLFLIEGNMHIKNVDYPSYYLYAACTLKKYRGKGLMSEMLDFAKKIAISRNCFFIALKPAEKSLFDYYSRFGYKTAFKKKTVYISKLFDNGINKIPLQNSDAINVEIRDSFFENTDYFKWDKPSFDFAVEHHKFYGGKVFGGCNGYILYSVIDGVLTVKENTFPELEFINVIKNIALEKNISSVQADSSFYSLNENFKSEIIDSGMLIPLCPKAESLIKTLDNAYLSLTLD